MHSKPEDTKPKLLEGYTHSGPGGIRDPQGCTYLAKGGEEENQACGGDFHRSILTISATENGTSQKDPKVEADLDRILKLG